MTTDPRPADTAAIARAADLVGPSGAVRLFEAGLLRGEADTAVLERISVTLALIAGDVERQARGAVYAAQKDELTDIAGRIADVALAARRSGVDTEPKP
jgi:hypothetical protein